MQQKPLPGRHSDRAISPWMLLVLAPATLCALWPAVVRSEQGGLPELDCIIKPYEISHVASGAEGVLKTLHVERNDLVEAGQVLAELEADVERASVALSLAKSQMTAEAQLRQATLGFDTRASQRIETLYRQNAIPLHVKDEANTDATKSRLQLEKARDALTLARLELAKSEALLRLKTVRSPITGVVLERFKSAGDFISDQPIFKIAQIDPLTVEVIAPVELFGSIEPGMRGEVLPELQDAGLHTATVTMVDRVIDAASGTFDVRLELPNPNHELPSGLRCVVQFLPAPKSVLASHGLRRPNQHTAMPVSLTGALEPPLNVQPTADQELSTRLKPPAVSIATENPTEPITMESDPLPYICRSIGPIESNEQVEILEQALAVQATRITHREGTESVIHSYMVLTARQSNPAETEAVQTRLRAAGIEDQHLLRRGENKGRVSLGVYASKGWAQARQADLTKLGFNTQIAARTKTRALFWLNLHMTEDEVNEMEILHTAERIAPDSIITLSPCSLAVTQVD